MKTIFFLFVAAIMYLPCSAQTKDVFVMLGSDFTPGVRSNLNIGAGYSMKKSNWFGNEPTFSYTYENAGNRGFWHTDQGAHTETLGWMDNLIVRKRLVYLWPQAGVTSFTGGDKVRNRLYVGMGVGYVVPLRRGYSIWFQGMANKAVTTAWYGTTSVGLDYSFGGK